MKVGDDQKKRESNMTFFRIAALFVVAMLMIATAVPAAHAQNTVGTITQFQAPRTSSATARPSRQRRIMPDDAA